MIPLIIAGVGAAAAGVYTIGSHMAIKDLKDDIESINRNASNQIEETKELIKETNNKLNRVYDIAAKQKEMIYSTTLKRTQDITKKIKIKQSNLEFKNEIRDISSNMSSIKESTLPKVANVAAIGLTCAISNVAGAFAGGLIGNTVVGVAMTFKKEEAEEQYARVKAECEIAKTECSKRKQLTRKIVDTVNVVAGLDKMTKDSLDNVGKILSNKGYDMTYWTESECDSVMTLLNLAKAMADIINCNIVIDNGGMSSEYMDKINEQRVKIINSGYEVPDKITVD